MKIKTIWIGALVLLIGFLIFIFTFNAVYIKPSYQYLLLPYINIIGQILMVFGLYLLIREKIKINEFFKLTKWKAILSLVIFIILSKIFLSLWPTPIATCLGSGCGTIFEASRILAKLAFPILMLSYVLSSAIICSINKFRRIQIK